MFRNLIRTIVLWIAWVVIAALVLVLILIAFIVTRAHLYNRVVGNETTPCTVTRVTSEVRNGEVIPTSIIVDCPGYKDFYLDVNGLPKSQTHPLKPGDTIACPVTVVEGPAGILGDRTMRRRDLDKQGPCKQLVR